MEQRNITRSNDSSDLDGIGYLVVHVTTAGGAIPLEGAKVDIQTYDPESASEPETRGDTVASLITGSDGNTVRIPLSTPPKALSESPGNGRPYSLYQAEVTLEGYYSQTHIGIPMFDGITSIQPILLIPLSENGTLNLPREDSIRYYESMGADL